MGVALTECGFVSVWFAGFGSNGVLAVDDADEWVCFGEEFGGVVAVVVEEVRGVEVDAEVVGADVGEGVEECVGGLGSGFEEEVLSVVLGEGAEVPHVTDPVAVVVGAGSGEIADMAGDEGDVAFGGPEHLSRGEEHAFDAGGFGGESDVAGGPGLAFEGEEE